MDIFNYLKNIEVCNVNYFENPYFNNFDNIFE